MRPDRAGRAFVLPGNLFSCETKTRQSALTPVAAEVQTRRVRPDWSDFARRAGQKGQTSISAGTPTRTTNNDSGAPSRQ